MDLEVEPDPECPVGFGDEEAREVRRAIADASGRYRLPGARPEQVARFCSIEVVMDGADGSIPYLTARDEVGTARVALSTRAILAGNLWPESMETLAEWMTIREHELWANWKRVQRGEAPEWIQPIDWGAVEPK